LAVRVLEHERILIAASDLCGELDCLVALALGARKYQFSRPQMTTSNVIRIEAGRHPLQELTVPVYILNDCFVAGGTGDDEMPALAWDLKRRLSRKALKVQTFL
jgi:DNA mismatch repair protein MSH5